MSMQYFPHELQSVPVLTALDLQDVLSDGFERETVYSPTEQSVDVHQLMKDKLQASQLMSRLIRLEESQLAEQHHQLKPEYSTLQSSSVVPNKCQQNKKLNNGDISFLEALLSPNGINGSGQGNRPDRLDLFLDEFSQNDRSTSTSTSPSSPPTPTDGSWSVCGQDDDILAYDDDAMSSNTSSPLSVSDPVFKQLLEDVNGPACNEITDVELTQLSVKELNRRLKNMDAALSQRLKQRRRLLKNRGYAQTCRSRRIRQQKSLTKQNESLAITMSSVQAKCKQLQKERDEYKKKYENLLLFVGKST